MLEEQLTESQIELLKEIKEEIVRLKSDIILLKSQMASHNISKLVNISCKKCKKEKDCENINCPMTVKNTC